MVPDGAVQHLSGPKSNLTSWSHPTGSWAPVPVALSTLLSLSMASSISKLPPPHLLPGGLFFH